MKRRTLLAGAWAGVAALVGGAAAAEATRADVAVEPMTCGEGDPASVERTVTDDSVEYLPASDAVRYDHGGRDSFGRWAYFETAELVAETVVPLVNDRLEVDVEGVGRGIRGLLFGSVVTVDHAVSRDREGRVLSEPNVSVADLVAVAPPTVTATVTLDGRSHTRDVPVAVEHVEYRQA